MSPWRSRPNVRAGAELDFVVQCRDDRVVYVEVKGGKSNSLYEAILEHLLSNNGLYGDIPVKVLPNRNFRLRTERQKLRGAVSSRAGRTLIALDAFSLLLPRCLRERVFTPARNDLALDHAETKESGGRWVTCALWFQAILLMLDCLRVLVLDRILWLVPKRLRQWWSV